MIIGRSRICDTADTAQLLLRGFNDPDRCRTLVLVSLLLPNRTCPKERLVLPETPNHLRAVTSIFLVAALAATDGV